MTKFCMSLLGVVALVMTGCGGNVVVVKGKVTRGGQPLAAGMIAFEPEANSGTIGAGANRPIRDGEFEIGSDKQLAPGRYVVRVSPEPLGSGTDLKKAPPQFKPYETTMEIKSSEEEVKLDVPVR